MSYKIPTKNDFESIESIVGRDYASMDDAITASYLSKTVMGLEGVILLAATNRPDMLDPALLRVGRFGRHIEISPPDEKAREIIFNIHLKNKPLAKDLSIQDMVKRLYGYTGADILTTECPFCFRNFYDANEKYNHELKVIGLLELIDKYDLMEIIEKPDDNYILNLKRLRE